MHVPSEQRPPGFNHSLHMSDGRVWSAGVPTGLADDYCSFFFNPFRNGGCTASSRRARGGDRVTTRRIADFLKGADWSRSVYWTNADRLDEPEPEGRYPARDAPQLYSLNAVAYESVLLGMH